MNRLAARPFMVASFNFILAVDPSPQLQSPEDIVECLWRMMRMEAMQSRASAPS